MKKQPSRSQSRASRPIALLIVLLALMGIMGISVVSAQEPTPVPPAGASRQALVAALAQSGAQITYSPINGQAIFIGTNSGRFVRQPATLRPGAGGEGAARGFLSVYGSLFGIKNQANELTRINEKRPDPRRTFERFQQVYNGVPVVGGELNIQVDSSSNIVSANGETLPDISLSTTPTISAATATQIALGAVVRNYKIAANRLSVTQPTLWVYNPQLITDQAGDTELVWRMEVKATDLTPINQFVLVDAHRGHIALQFNQIDALDTPDTATYTANNGISLPGTLVCTTNQSCGGNIHAQAAHDNAASTFYFYANNFNRNSIDNVGMQIVSTVHFGNQYQNAFWSGNQMVYGDYANYPLALDVVAHELTHGVTQYESNLFYAYQSGAINESLSDVFGEAAQLQANGLNSDPQWLLGETILSTNGHPGIRSMSDPTVFKDPDRINSPYYYLGDGDNGGVHLNSGVNNKTAYLISQGGSFNGKVIVGLGLSKMIHIYYEAQTHILTSASNYLDLYNALYQSCLNLAGNTAGITTGDCQQVRNATLAVGMNVPPTPNYFLKDAPLCPTGSVVDNTLFSDDFETVTGNWSFDNQGDAAGWGYSTTYPHSGAQHLYADDYSPYYNYYGYPSNDFATLNVTPFHIPPNAYLSFAHFYAFDPPNYDAGIVEYSINGGAGWVDAGNLFDVNGYNGIVATGWGNSLSGSKAFVRSDHQYAVSRMNLASLVGKDVMFRWRMSTDSTAYFYGWFLDDVQIYSCISLNAAPTRNYYTDGHPTLTWNRVTGASGYKIQVSQSNTFATLAFSADVPNTQLEVTVSPTTLTDGVYYWRVSANGGAKWSVVDSFTVDVP